MEEGLKLAGQYGFPLVVAVYFLWRDLRREKKTEQREKALADRLTVLEDRLHELQSDTIRECTAALTALDKRPCLWKASASGHHAVPLGPAHSGAVPAT
jgi:hypothetical protein